MHSSQTVTDEYDAVLTDLRMIFAKAFGRSMYGIIDIGLHAKQLMDEAAQLTKANKSKQEVLPILKDLRHRLMMDLDGSERKGWL